MSKKKRIAEERERRIQYNTAGAADIKSYFEKISRPYPVF